VEDKNLRAQRQNRYYREKQKNSQTKYLRAVKGIYKDSAIPSREQTCESWASKKEKRCKPNI
jgi:hypothetical protein